MRVFLKTVMFIEKFMNLNSRLRRLKMQKNTIKKVLKYIKHYSFLSLLSLIFAALTVALTLYVPILIGQGIDCIVSKGNVNFEELKLIAIKIVIVILLTAVLQWLMNICNNKITYNVVR